MFILYGDGFVFLDVIVVIIRIFNVADTSELRTRWLIWCPILLPGIMTSWITRVIKGSIRGL